MTWAKQSTNGKFVVCGQCGTSLCRRDRMGAPTRDPGYYLVWGDGWRVVVDEIRAAPLPPLVHVERQAGAVDRLAAGHPPTRHDWTNAERFELSRALRAYAPATCDTCGEANEIDPKRLRVKGIAPYR